MSIRFIRLSEIGQFLKSHHAIPLMSDFPGWLDQCFARKDIWVYTQAFSFFLKMAENKSAFNNATQLHKYANSHVKGFLFAPNSARLDNNSTLVLCERY